MFVSDGTGICLHVCNFDCNNLAWIGKAVLASIILDLCETVEKYLRYDASVPEVFCAIIQKQQHVNSSVVFMLVQALQKMRPTDELGKDVEKFGNKISEMARFISGAGSAHIDISALLSTAFIY